MGAKIRVLKAEVRQDAIPVSTFGTSVASHVAGVQTITLEIEPWGLADRHELGQLLMNSLERGLLLQVEGAHLPMSEQGKVMTPEEEPSPPPTPEERGPDFGSW